MVAAAAKFPEFMRRAQAQMDKVCGSDILRLPDFDVCITYPTKDGYES